MCDEHGVCQSMRNVVHVTKLVGHAVADAQESVCKGHASQRRSVVHVGTGRDISWVPLGSDKVVEDEFACLEGESLSVIGGKNRNVGLQGVSQCIQTSASSERLWHGSRELRIDDGHFRGKGIVRNGVFSDNSVSVVCDHCEWSDLRSRSRGCGNANQLLDFRAPFGKVNNSFPDIHESNVKSCEVKIWMLIHHSHDLGSVHGRSASDCNYAVRVETLHGFNSCSNASQRGVWCHFLENIGFNAIV
mmetsp:Transcript_27735/g.38332  ORF Transcript_27735/g.38332 Transcript_27735/m.38332 type:complete len:246 (-) Transcript_27735:2039-2776(-)